MDRRGAARDATGRSPKRVSAAARESMGRASTIDTEQNTGDHWEFRCTTRDKGPGKLTGFVSRMDAGLRPPHTGSRC